MKRSVFVWVCIGGRLLPCRVGWLYKVVSADERYAAGCGRAPASAPPGSALPGSTGEVRGSPATPRLNF